MTDTDQSYRPLEEVAQAYARKLRDLDPDTWQGAIDAARARTSVVERRNHLIDGR